MRQFRRRSCIRMRTARTGVDWIIIGTDVENSTAAITAGRYKDVTVAGAIGTISIANITGSLDFPFFFGGDGMVFLLPGRYRSDVLDVPADVRQTVREISELSLRAGIVSVGELRRRGHDLRIGRVKITERYSQAIADERALAAFDILLTDDTDATVIRPADASCPGGRRADFRGFSCLRNDIKSGRGETVSLIVLPRSGRPGSGGRGDGSGDLNEIGSSNRSGSVTESIDIALTRSVLLQARQIIDRIVGDETTATPSRPGCSKNRSRRTQRCRSGEWRPTERVSFRRSRYREGAGRTGVLDRRYRGTNRHPVSPRRRSIR